MILAAARDGHADVREGGGDRRMRQCTSPARPRPGEALGGVGNRAGGSLTQPVTPAAERAARGVDD